MLTKAPDADAYSNDYVTKALALVKADGVDAVGAGFKPLTVTLRRRRGLGDPEPGSARPGAPRFNFLGGKGRRAAVGR